LKKKDYNNIRKLMCLGWPREASTWSMDLTINNTKTAQRDSIMHCCTKQHTKTLKISQSYHYLFSWRIEPYVMLLTMSTCCHFLGKLC